MAIVNRLSRLFRADVHAVLDRLEEPEVLLRQAIREMEDEVGRNAQQLKAREFERKQCRSRLAEVDKSIAAVGAELELCFAVGNELLVRTLLRRRLESERLAKHLGQRAAGLDAAIEQLRKQTEEQRGRLEEMRQKAAIFEVEAAHGDGGDAAGWSAGETGVTEADVDLALLRERQKRSAS